MTPAAAAVRPPTIKETIKQPKLFPIDSESSAATLPPI